MSEKIEIGLIGLGSMGTAMAARLLGQGFAVSIWNRTSKRHAELDSAGANFVSLSEALKKQFVISFLSNDVAALDVFSEANLAEFE
jgi:3-hydroxyisobutyrate dehydrogenase